MNGGPRDGEMRPTSAILEGHIFAAEFTHAATGKQRAGVWQAAEMASGYDYTADHTYWTIRKIGERYDVVRVDQTNSIVETAPGGNGYMKAGAAATYAAQLSYHQAQDDTLARLRDFVIDLDAPPDRD